MVKWLFTNLCQEQLSKFFFSSLHHMDMIRDSDNSSSILRRCDTGHYCNSLLQELVHKILLYPYLYIQQLLLLTYLLIYYRLTNRRRILYTTIEV